jgi:IgGFc binding protein
MRNAVGYLFVLASVSWAACSSDRGAPNSEHHFLVEPDASADAACSGIACSKDLRSVRDCYGNVVTECPADKACGNGECIAPCDAAAMNEGSIGCSFAIPGATAEFEGFGSCAAFVVANNWTSPATVRLELKGEEKSLADAVWVPFVEKGVLKHRKLDGPIPPGEAAVVFVSEERTGADNWIGCPRGVKPIFDKEQALRGTGIGDAVMISADVPIAAYSIYPYGGNLSTLPSATLLLPTSSFRKNYIAVTSWGGKSDNFGGGAIGQPGRPFVQIVATEDDTSIDILPRVEIVGGIGIAPGAKNVVATYKLQRGQYMQLTQGQDLVGSVIETSKPVGLFGGNSCMQVPGQVQYCDTDSKQIPPLSAWGHEYAVVPTPNRARWASRGRQQERDPNVVRMVGAVDGTQLVYEPVAPEGAPETLESGQMERFFASEPFVVRSQDAAHNFYVATVMTGSQSTGSKLGDPETSVASPTDQWLESYGFFSDATYIFSAAIVTRRRHNGEFRDVMLDCAGALTGWQRITEDYEWAFVEFSRGQRPVPNPGGVCTDGAHRAHSEAPFTLHVWGIGFDSSYSYAGGTGLRPLTDVRVPVH